VIRDKDGSLDPALVPAANPLRVRLQERAGPSLLSPAARDTRVSCKINKIKEMKVGSQAGNGENSR